MAVRMRHDGIEQTIEVPEASVQVYERSGWVVVDGDQAAAGGKAEAKGRRQAKGSEG